MFETALDRMPTDKCKVVIRADKRPVGSPRHMHEYAQDAMLYVRTCGRPDLFITFTCNPNWNEIKEELLAGQVPSDRHDLIARVFKQKLNKLMDKITRSQPYGETRCWMYSVEWQERGLPHAHILIWLRDKIRPTQSETQTGNDGYPLYRRRRPGEGGFTAIVKLKINDKPTDFKEDNRKVLPYSPMLCKMFEAHINVEYCNSITSIKYICKYVNKGRNMVVFRLENENGAIDEIMQYLMGTSSILMKEFGIF
ncbi:phage tail component protein [Ancylostoma ceylanicum]|uniref:Phage tail component protein n=1 Tax=Ancylostoma ceylanicum TaxID=53326 RepID=A0A0D6L578_9BILA|nr:phage tail component protein [Ancylostoma ceylanicum]